MYATIAKWSVRARRTIYIYNANSVSITNHQRQKLSLFFNSVMPKLPIAASVHVVNLIHFIMLVQSCQCMYIQRAKFRVQGKSLDPRFLGSGQGTVSLLLLALSSTLRTEKNLQLYVASLTINTNAYFYIVHTKPTIPGLAKYKITKHVHQSLRTSSHGLEDP